MALLTLYDFGENIYYSLPKLAELKVQEKLVLALINIPWAFQKCL